MSQPSDNIYAKPLGEVGGFRFDERVVKVFPDMIQRSVPGYESIIATTGVLAGHFAQPNTNLYDLGASLGASTLSMLPRLHPSNRLFAIDNSHAMVEGLRQKLTLMADDKVEIIEANVLDHPIENASFVVMNFTLQFIALEQRDALIKRIFDGLQPGGALLLSEKIRMQEPSVDELYIDVHEEFKVAQGYSELEVAQKRASLENVLIPETIAEHQTRLLNANFSSCNLWFQCLNFCSLLAIKQA